MINEDLPHHVRSPEDWKPIPGSLDAIARLNRAGCRVVIATNQPGIRRRCFTFEDLNRIHIDVHDDPGSAVDALPRPANHGSEPSDVRKQDAATVPGTWSRRSNRMKWSWEPARTPEIRVSARSTAALYCASP